MFPHGFEHGGVVVIPPCSRDGLVGRVGEEIRVMDVDKDTLSGFRSAFGERDHVLFVTPTCGMVDPHTQTHGVHSIGTQERDTVFVPAERHAVMLHLAEPTQVTTSCPRPTGTIGLVIAACQQHGRCGYDKNPFHNYSHFRCKITKIFCVMQIFEGEILHISFFFCNFAPDFE